jgi:hypothetical protein
MEQRHLSERESKLMIAAQMPLDQKGRRERKRIFKNINQCFGTVN